MNTVEFLVDRHVRNGLAGKTALVGPARRCSYGELRSLSLACMGRLRSWGVRRGSALFFLCDDAPESVVYLLAAWRIGASAILANPDLPADDLLGIAERLGPFGIVHSGTGRAKALACAESAGLPAMGMEPLESLAGYAPPDGPPWEDVGADGDLLCLFSSGSTGRPKAIMHRHGDLLHVNELYAGGILGLGPSDTTFSASRLFFAYGFNSLHMALWAGGTCVLPEGKFSADSVLERLGSGGVTLFFSVPTVYRLLLEKSAGGAFPSVRACISAGEPLPGELYRRWLERHGLPIVDGLGTTETLLTFISNRLSDPEPDCTGRPVEGCRVRLVTESGREAREGEIGECWVAAPTLPDGFWKDREASSSAFEDGWFKTKDLFVRDAEGKFRYQGRKNDMIKVGGAWLSPVLLEQAVARHPDVKECAVVQRAEFGTLLRPQAFVVVREGVRPSPELVRQLQDHARRHLGPHQYPHYVEFVPVLPRTATGKLQRFKLREEAPGDASALLAAIEREKP